MMGGGMRLCLMIEGQEGVGWDEWVALAAACERAGLDGLFRSDHYLSVIGDRGRVSLDALTTLAGLAAITQRVRLGTLVSPVTFRHPSVLAKSFATLDHISGGRAELGLGAGWNEDEHAAYGIPFPALGARMEMLEEQLAIVHRQWTDDEVTFSGRHYALVGCPAQPKPLQRPRPPIIVGGSAGPRSIALAVRFADEYNTLLASVDDCRERKARLVAACEAAGRDPVTLPMSLMVTCVVGEDRTELLRRVRRVRRVAGAADEDPEGVLHERAERWLAGTPEDVVERLGQLEAAGVERVYLQHLAHDDVDMVSLIGEAVVPAVDR
jgi:F420-dependent oxidoreductase-like protein